MLLLRSGTAEQNHCSKLIRKLCWNCWIQLCQINLLHNRKSLLQTATSITKMGNIIGSSSVARRVLWNRVCPSFRSPFRPSICPGILLDLYHYLFLNFGMVLETHMKLCVTELDFPGKFFLPQKWGKWAKNRVFWIYWKI